MCGDFSNHDHDYDHEGHVHEGHVHEDHEPGEPYAYPGPEVPFGQVVGRADLSDEETRMQRLAESIVQGAVEGLDIVLPFAVVLWLATQEGGEQAYTDALNAAAQAAGFESHASLPMVRMAVQFPTGETFGINADGTTIPLPSVEAPAA